MGLLQIATGITKCDDYYKLRQYTVSWSPLYKLYHVQILNCKIPERVLLNGAICKRFSKVLRRWRCAACHLSSCTFLPSISSLLQSATAFFVTKCDGLLLQSATAFLLLSVTSVITKCDRYYKVRRLLQSATVHTSLVNILNWAQYLLKRKFLRNCSKNYLNTILKNRWLPIQAFCS